MDKKISNNLDLSKYKVLYLTLTKKAFEVMITGEKQEEYRNASDWIRSRLYYRDGYTKEYNMIKFTKGYGKNKPYFIAEYLGFMINCSNSIPTKHYSNGLAVDVKLNDYVICLGKILEKGNIKPNEKQEAQREYDLYG